MKLAPSKSRKPAARRVRIHGLLARKQKIQRRVRKKRRVSRSMKDRKQAHNLLLRKRALVESYNNLVADYEAKVEELRRATMKLDMLEKRSNELSLKIRDAENLAYLQRFLEMKNANTHELVLFIELQKQLAKMGFDSNAIRLVGEEMKRLGVEPRELARVIKLLMSKSETFEKGLAELETKVEAAKEKESIALARADSLNTQADEAQKRILALQDYLASQSRILENEYEMRRRVLDSRIQEERARAEAETLELLKMRDKMAGELQTLRDEEAAMKKKNTVAEEPASN